MKKEYYMYSGCLLVVIFTIVCFVTSKTSEAFENTLDSVYESGFGSSEGDMDFDHEDSDSDTSKKENIVTAKPDTDPKSKTVIVNKEYPISSGYKPDDLVVPDVDFSFDYEDEKRYLRKEAAEALEDMFSDAGENGHILLATSGFRSYGRQTTLYNYNLMQKGYEYTNIYSAKPGTSEHQTGWAIDITCDSADGKLTVEFANTKEGKWVAKNCYKYGFVLRYPKDKEKVTQYGYEPWHFRYVGYSLAKYLTENNLTLDEYYGYKPNELFIEREQMAYYDKLLNNKKQQITTVTEAEMDDLTEDAGEETNDDTAVSFIPVITMEPIATTTPTVRPLVTERPVETRRPQSTQGATKTEEPKETEEPIEPDDPEATYPVTSEAPVETEMPSVQEPLSTTVPSQHPDTHH